VDDEIENLHRAIPNSTVDEAGEGPSELPPPVLKGEGAPSPRPLTPLAVPPAEYEDNVGFFNPEVIPNSDVVGPLFL
jgi:hypothetical protein